MPFALFRQSASGIAEYIVFGTMPSEMNPASRRPTARLAFLLFHRWPCLPLEYRLGNHRFQEEKDMKKIPLTIRGAELLKNELQQLKSVARPEVIAAIAEARSHGDLSENAEYEAAKEKQGFIEGRIAEIEHKLSHAHIINPAEIHAEGKVVFGATLMLEDLDSGDHVRYQIVGEDEADIKAGKISVVSPIARALIGKEVGDVAEVQAPGGVREYEIVEVQYV